MRPTGRRNPSHAGYGRVDQGLVRTTDAAQRQQQSWRTFVIELWQMSHMPAAPADQGQIHAGKWSATAKKPSFGGAGRQSITHVRRFTRNSGRAKNRLE